MIFSFAPYVECCFWSLQKEFAELVDRSLLFKVESRNDQTFKLEQSFRVKKVCFDDVIINKFNDSSMKLVMRTLFYSFFYNLFVIIYLFINTI